MVQMIISYRITIVFLLVAVPAVAEKLTTTSEGRRALGGMVFIIMGRVILASSSFTTSPGIARKNISSIAEAIKQRCVNVENR